MKSRNFFSRLWLLLIAPFTHSSTSGSSNSASVFTPTELAKGLVVIDVRTQAEYSAGHVEGALLLPYRQIAKMISAQVPDKSSPIVLYCHLGGRAAMARRSLRKAGYDRVENFHTLKKAARKLNKEIVI